ncbi:hypothetical protein [Janthinobacterium sp. RB2R34]|uniref:hypothetical protein n=1 Tax=Janthinobacterium sp. RB2R34 TaxID=3424193 RepID=UPI003F212919
MQQFFATVAWQRDGQDFGGQRYSRAHAWQFAHERCHIASSLKADVVVEAR